jgi:hypothetical protein
MTDIEILKEMLDQSMIVCLQEKQEGTHIRYSVILKETQYNYSVSIEGMPNPDEVIIIDAEKFKVIPHVFKGNKGQGKRADFVIVANTKTEKIILCIELKKTKKPPDFIIKQLKGAKCFMIYCQALVKNFWEKHDFLDGYEYRFVTIGHINTNKTTTRMNNRKGDNASTSEIHDSPEKMLRERLKSQKPTMDSVLA